ncbi:MAG: M20/M25/M40 family metallo-hydrolase, partial [Candidatus Latescibacteria bacterium]|nr:M20/M25/M40 family metallo-hydrolase [Candidatus Latescibacterota bacterium]
MSLETERRVLDEIFASSEAYENLLVLTDEIGPRLAGTANEARARDFLAATCTRYGLQNVRSEAFPHQAWTPVHEMLAISEPITRDLACRCAGLSPSTPGAGVEAEVVFLESGDRREFQDRAREVNGRLVLAPYYPVPRQVKTPLAAQNGAVALIETRNAPGGLQPARTCAFGRKADIPVASISLEDAEFIRRLAERRGPVRLRLTLDSRTEVKESWNVVGEIPGTRGGPEQIVIGGHYDTWHVGPGAVDNAAGVVAVLEAARGLVKAEATLGRTLKVALFGVEESGLVGSWAYTHQHEDELDHTVLMINNDVGGRPSGISISGFEELEAPLSPIADRVRIAG